MDNYIIKILCDYKDYQLFNWNKFNASISLLKNCDDATFNNIIFWNKLDNNFIEMK